MSDSDAPTPPDAPDDAARESAARRLPQAGELPRRSFLGVASLCLGACAGASALGVVGTVLVGTPLGRESAGARWIDLGPLAAFAPGSAIKLAAEGELRDAWNRFPARSLGRVLVVRGEGQALAVFSAVCPHNGCDVFVEEEDFLCPCHDSRFARDGALLAGESPRGLDPLEHKVEDERLWVRLVRYEVGIAERKPV